MCEWLLYDLQIPSLNYLKTEKINKISDKLLGKKIKLTIVVSRENLKNTKL